ncbi:helix-turn-helix domain-containing protein [Paenibacillus senegalimassiliensis]|uniref:helix-turn-helix domain-containing protein n=1 Tax=Paenibacillus senegalimassiliensis TaxID=1737426 RepID=UPI00073EA60A|nr:AraC family transcriptional regulator [Paenibacillus senegalimassiliensis]
MKTMSKWRKVWVWIYLPVVFTAILTFLIVSACNSYIVAAQQQNLKQRDDIKAFSQSIERQLKELDKQLSLRIVKNGYMNRFLLRTDDTKLSMTDYYASQELRALLGDHKLLQSVYLYRGQDQQILSTGYKNAASQFHDREYLQSLLAEGAYNQWSSARELSEYPLSVPAEQVISLAKNMSSFSGSDGAIVVSVKLKELFSRAAAGNFSEKFSVLVTDANDQPLYSNLSQTYFVDDKSKGLSLPNETMLIGPGWKIESQLLDDSLSRAAEQAVVIRNLTVVAGILAILICFIIYFRKAFRPLKQILSQIEASGLAALHPSHGQDEYAIIGETITKWTDHMKEYSQQQTKAKEQLKQHFFRELLYDEEQTIPASIMEEESKHYGVGEQGNTLALMIIEIDGYEQLNLSGRKDEVKQNLLNMVKQWAEEHHCQVWTEWTMSKRLTVMTSLPGGMAGDTHFLTAQSVFEWTQARLEWSVTIGVGQSVILLRQVHKAYKQALFALQHKLTSGGGRVLTSKEVAGRELALGKDFLQLTEEAAEKFKSLSEDWKQVLNQYFDELDKQKLSDEHVRMLLALLVSRFEIMMESMKIEIRQFWAEQIYPKLLREIKHSELLYEIRESCLSLLGATFDEVLLENENRSQRRLAQQIRTYIETSYSDPDLSLDRVSEAVGINGKYASQLFKEEFKINYSEFVAGLRLHKASRLLLETNAPVQEVAREVGYLHAISFGRVFKKATGLSPGEYRKNKREMADIGELAIN